MVQTPVAMPLMVPLPLAVQTVGVVLLKPTARPEVAVAETVPVPPTAIDGAGSKLTVWLALPRIAVKVADTVQLVVMAPVV